MKVISDDAVERYLWSNLTKTQILEKFQPALLNGLKDYNEDPDKIIPPRISQLSNNPNSSVTHLYMPCISPNEVGIKVISGGPSSKLGFQGCVLILDEFTGVLEAVINAKTLTAFRTALASTLGLVKVIHPDNKDILKEITVFGVGLQSYWHIALSLKIYGESILQVNIINRSIENAQNLADKLKDVFPFTAFNSFSFDQEDAYVGHIQNSSIIFGCTPSTVPVIKSHYINKDPKYPKFISLIGSYKANMIELELDFINSEFKSTGTSIIVDSKDHTLLESGELIQGGIERDQLVDLVELYETNDSTSNYVSPHNITFQKLVGLSIMDLSMGKLISKDITSDKAVVIDDF
ncbi:hypothetical protein DFJ63DRAFT_102933 [Scheffersomyces coipomensis]|uniref:uncharacterized protein n=1 Tax=Scheffersomyces coipomensis TaxID=1788519 RepID=UPI00315CBC7A